jgi:hypothetical protein
MRISALPLGDAEVVVQLRGRWKPPAVVARRRPLLPMMLRVLGGSSLVEGIAAMVQKLS